MSQTDFVSLEKHIQSTFPDGFLLGVGERRCRDYANRVSESTTFRLQKEAARFAERAGADTRFSK